MRQRREQPEGLELRVVDQVGEAADPAAGQSLGDEQRLPLGSGSRPQALLEQAVQLVAVLDPGGIGGEARVVRHLCHPEGRCQPAELAVAGCAGEQRSVAGGEDLVGRDHRRLRAEPPRDRSAAEVARDVVPEPGDGGLEQARLHRAAATGSRALLQRRQDADGRPHSGGDVDDRGADAHRRALGLAGHAHQAGVRLQQGVVAGAVALRAAGAEAADRAVDQPGIVGAQLLGPQAATGQGAGTEALHHHVGLPRQPAHDGRAVGGVEGDGEAALVAVDAEEHRALAVPRRR